MILPVTQRPVGDGNWRPSGRIPRDVRAVVLHVTEGSAASCRSWFNDPAADVSAHFLVTRAGQVEQFVGVHDVAYHAGTVYHSTWAGLADLPTPHPNTYTVGIEHEGTGQEPWPAAQLFASVVLSAWLAARFDLDPSPRTFPLHREIRASKTCPGPTFDRAAYLARVSALRRVWGLDELRALLPGLR